MPTCGEGVSSARAAKVLKIGKVLKVMKVLRVSKAVRFSQENAAALDEIMLTSSLAHFSKRIATLVLTAYLWAHLLACLWAYTARSGYVFFFFFYVLFLWMRREP